MTPGSSSDNVSQVEYVGPPRSSGLTMSFGCCGACGTDDEVVGQGEDGEWTDQAALDAGGGGSDDAGEQSVPTTEVVSTEGVSTNQPRISGVGWVGADPQYDRVEDREVGGGVGTPEWRQDSTSWMMHTRGTPIGIRCLSLAQQGGGSTGSYRGARK